ncbi:hypothetical protein D3C78_1546480 [compost metagenome]
MVSSAALFQLAVIKEKEPVFLINHAGRCAADYGVAGEYYLGLFSGGPGIPAGTNLRHDAVGGIATVDYAADCRGHLQYAEG